MTESRSDQFKRMQHMIDSVSIINYGESFACEYNKNNMIECLVKNMVNRAEFLDEIITNSTRYIITTNMMYMQEKFINLSVDLIYLITLMNSEPKQYSNRDYLKQNINKNMNDLHAIFSKKNKDYGDAFLKFGIIGIIVRLGDKFYRLNTLSKSTVSPAVTDESFKDTLLDIYNYCIIAIMLLDDYYRENDINQIKTTEYAMNMKYQLVKESNDLQSHLDEVNSDISDMNSVIQNMETK